MSNKSERQNITADAAIDQIRELIFGDQTIEFRQQIKALQEECQALQREITQLKQQNVESAELMSKSISRLNLAESADKQINDLLEQFKTELNHRLTDLDSRKVDKSQIGEVFIEWGMKVKQTHPK
jgi:chromosome segregation ATPase